jgi:hypothetical protein
LHRHSHDKQQQLADIEDYIVDGKFTLKVYNDLGQLVYNQMVSGSPSALHKWWKWHWDTYGSGDQATQQAYNLNLADASRYAGEQDPFERPLYYHVYMSGSYYYVQYWYYFGMNDLTDQVPFTWHESDWEHVSIKLSNNNGVFVPLKVNFYVHNGGRTFSASDSWWSPYLGGYTGIQQGYAETRTHLHVWIAANSHASYNRYSSVYEIEGYLNIPGYYSGGGRWVDRVDYDPAGNDLYFTYFDLVKLGEVSTQTPGQCPDSGYWLSVHSYAIGPESKHWLGYRGRTGDYSGMPGVQAPSPRMPSMEESGPSHEWWQFTDSPFFGNDLSFDYIFTNAEIRWIPDDSVGD